MTAGTPRRVLILGGTAEARALAMELSEAGADVESSLAGRVSRPRLPVGRVRIGGFGGVDGLVAHLREQSVEALVDATHPFAATMTAHACAAAERSGLPLVRLVRPGWAGDPRARDWHWVPDYGAAAATAERLGHRPFLTTGRQTLRHFETWAGRPVLVRVVEPLEQVPPGWRVILDRGPYSLDGERRLLREHRIDVLVTKDSGGSYTAAKLTAAAETGAAVVVVRRPATPTGAYLASDVEAVLALLGFGGRSTHH